jgi:hypothetical protein
VSRKICIAISVACFVLGVVAGAAVLARARKNKCGISAITTVAWSASITNLVRESASAEAAEAALLDHKAVLEANRAEIGEFFYNADLMLVLARLAILTEHRTSGRRYAIEDAVAACQAAKMIDCSHGAIRARAEKGPGAECKSGESRQAPLPSAK